MSETKLQRVQIVNREHPHFQESAFLDRIALLEQERDAYERTACDMANNADFYRGIVHGCGAPFGVKARTSDDGSVQDSVLALKVPELVAALKQERDALRAALANIRPFMIEGVTAGANPRKEGGMSPPLWHMKCRACDTRWSVSVWKEPIDSHPESPCWFAQALTESR